MKHIHLLIFVGALFGLLVAITYGMIATANNDPMAVCLTRPWLDVKPPCR